MLLLWLKVEVSGNKPLFVDAYYKPDEINEQTLLELNKSLSFVPNRGNITWLLGNFNMPKMDWPRHSPSPDCKLPTLYNTFTEILDGHNLQQLVDTPTRGENILDLFCTKFKDHILLYKDTYNVESLWSDLKQHIEDDIKQHIPS